MPEVWSYAEGLSAPAQLQDNATSYSKNTQPYQSLHRLCLSYACIYRQRHPYKHVSALLEDLEPHITTVDQGPNQAPIRLLPKLSDLQKAGLSALAASIGKFGGVKRLSKMVGAQPASRCADSVSSNCRLFTQTHSSLWNQPSTVLKETPPSNSSSCDKWPGSCRSMI